MIIFRDHIRLLKLLGDYSNADDILKAAGEEMRHRVSRRLLELKVEGLTDIVGNVVTLTKAGRLVLDAIKWLESQGVYLEKLELPSDIWINSQVIKMLEVIDETGYIPEEWETFLKERALISDGELNQAAKLVLEAYKKSVPIIYITPDIAEFISGMPPGPASYDVLITYRNMFGYAQNAIHALEALRLLQLSPPWHGKVTYTLTRAGRLIREAVYEIPLYKPLMLVNGSIRVLLGKEVKELTVEQKKELESYGLFDVGKDEFTEAGRKLTKAYDLLTATREEMHPIYITKEEMRVLKFIKEEMEKGSGPVLEKRIREKLGDIDVGFVLHLLEFKEFIARELVENKDAYVLTEYGERVVKVFGDGFRDLTTEATKAITFAYAGDIPREDWVKEAQDAGLLSRGSLTFRGRTILEITTSIRRKIYVTVYDALILIKTPSKKSITREKLIQEVLESLEKKFKAEERVIDVAISEAESKGFIRVYQNDAVVLTRGGIELKNAIEMAKTEVIKGMKMSITPVLVDALRVIKENESEIMKAWKEKEEVPSLIIEVIRRKMKVSEDLAKELVTLLRAMGFLGKIGGRAVTSAGEQLLYAAQLIAEKPKELVGLARA